MISTTARKLDRELLEEHSFEVSSPVVLVYDVIEFQEKTSSGGFRGDTS